MEQIYKNLYYDEEERCYLFIDENDKRLVVDQQSYLLIYILENLLLMQNKQEVFDLKNE